MTITQQAGYASVDVWDGPRWVAAFASEADAKAFIAAGDLLAACQAFADGMRRQNKPSMLALILALEKADAAIAKATKGAGSLRERREAAGETE